MNGIKAAFTGRLGRDPEIRTTRAGKPWLRCSVAVDDEKADEPQWCSVAYFGEDAEQIHERLSKGAEVYAEGYLKLNRWTTRDGEERSGLNLVAWRLIALGAVGWKDGGSSSRPSTRTSSGNSRPSTRKTPPRTGDLGVEDPFEDAEIPF